MKLKGIKVLDLSLFLPGPMLTQMMADHGADVIKLEPLNGGEPNREIGPKRNGVSVYFANTHRGKRSIQLNLKTKAGQEIAQRLATEVDVIVESFRPGVTKRLGIDFETVKIINPQIVYASISAFGQTGPYAKKPAHDLAVQAYSGLISTNLGSDGKPAMPGVQSADMLSSLMGLSGILMALLRREESGRGDHIDLAMMDTLISCIPNNLGSVLAQQSAPKVAHERVWGGHAIYNIYETLDNKHIVLGASEKHFAERILSKFKRLDLLSLCEAPTGPAQDRLKQFLAKKFREKKQDYWINWFEDIDASFAPVNNLKEALNNPQLRYREMIVVDKSGNGHIGTPLKFREEPSNISFRAPGIGEHNEQIAKELGLDEKEINSLKRGGAFGE
ncbi:MAG: CoA transferase [Gammaproteobacteria bacterium TMED1]|nr:MAG: CoA transferase [Gammaproteobacteria bacterium TMED1]|tara:strand:+ start:2587 stop:3753 length:1167 start_codon:yes stop_codon:yes gene_type:complete